MTYSSGFFPPHRPCLIASVTSAVCIRFACVRACVYAYVGLTWEMRASARACAKPPISSAAAAASVALGRLHGNTRPGQPNSTRLRQLSMKHIMIIIYVK